MKGERERERERERSGGKLKELAIQRGVGAWGGWLYRALQQDRSRKYRSRLCLTVQINKPPFLVHPFWATQYSIEGL